VETAEALRIGLRNIEEATPFPLPPPRTIEDWIGSIGVIETGVWRTGGVGMTPTGPDPSGLVGTVDEAIGTVLGVTAVPLIVSEIEGSGTRPTAGWALGSRLRPPTWAEPTWARPTSTSPTSPTTTRRSMAILRPIPSGALRGGRPRELSEPGDDVVERGQSPMDERATRARSFDASSPSDAGE
jgi:hypothetical protein